MKTKNVTAIKVHWWGIELYIDHFILQKATSILELASLLGSLLGPVATPVVLSVFISIEVLKLFDNGYGIVIIRYGWILAPIIFPQ